MSEITHPMPGTLRPIDEARPMQGRVVVGAVDIPFGDLVFLLLKVSLAALPALIVVTMTILAVAMGAVMFLAPSLLRGA